MHLCVYYVIIGVIQYTTSYRIRRGSNNTDGFFFCSIYKTIEFHNEMSFGGKFVMQIYAV